MKKKDLFARLRNNTKGQYDMPEINVEGIKYKDTYAQFVNASKASGANVVEASDYSELNELITQLYPKAEVFASNLPYISLPGLNPDTVTQAAELNGTDVGVVEGTVGVAENACVWVPQTMCEKAVCFISEYLVIVLKRSCIVNNMHEAYERINFDERYNFGTFISGPSKTADIEQALVFGAQAAKGVTVVVIDK